MNAKPQLIETIRIQNGRVRNIKFHNQRCNVSRKKLFDATNEIDLRGAIDTQQVNSPEVKCRITFNDKIRKVEYEPYSIRPIRSLAIVEIGDYNYSHKYADREKLKSFFDMRGDKDDILMLRNGLLTDTYYANVALLKNETWYTPKTPLLHGTTRARLIHSKKIVPKNIHFKQIPEYLNICIFNAMIPFKNVILSQEKISVLIS